MIQWKHTGVTDVNGQLTLTFTDDDLPTGNHLLTIDVSISISVDVLFPVRIEHERSENSFTITVTNILTQLPAEAASVTLTLIGGL